MGRRKRQKKWSNFLKRTRDETGLSRTQDEGKRMGRIREMRRKQMKRGRERRGLI